MADATMWEEVWRRDKTPLSGALDSVWLRHLQLSSVRVVCSAHKPISCGVCILNTQYSFVFAASEPPLSIS